MSVSLLLLVMPKPWKGGAMQCKGWGQPHLISRVLLYKSVIFALEISCQSVSFT